MMIIAQIAMFSIALAIVSIVAGILLAELAVRIDRYLFGDHDE